MKKAIKRTFTILTAATTLLVSGASMAATTLTAQAACQYHRYDNVRLVKKSYGTEVQCACCGYVYYIIWK